MLLRSIRTWLTAGLFGIVGATSLPAAAQNFPSRSITIIVPFAAGGSTDVTARIVAKGLSEVWGKPVIVENSPGAGAVVGMGLGARAAPDGHTLTLVGNGMTQVPHLMKTDFDVLKDFAPVTQLLVFDQILVASPAFEARTLEDLVSLAKAKPDYVNFGSTGFGGEIVMSMLESAAGFKTVHVNYGGAGPVLTALGGNQVHVAVTDVAVSKPLIDAGKIRALAVTGLTRNRLLPNVPTIDSTVAGFEFLGWFGLAAPGRTPRAVVDQIHRDTLTVLRNPEIRQQLEGSGGKVIGNTPDEFARLIHQQYEASGAIIRKAGIVAK